MFSSISWEQYWQFIAIITSIYYISIIITFKRGQLNDLLTGKRKMSPPSVAAPLVKAPVLPEFDFSQSQPAAMVAPQTEPTAQMSTSSNPAEINRADSEPESTVEIDAVDDEKTSEANLKHIERITDQVSNAMSEYGKGGNKEELIQKLAVTFSQDPEFDELIPFREALAWQLHQVARITCEINLLDLDIKRIWTLAESSTPK